MTKSGAGAKALNLRLLRNSADYERGFRHRFAAQLLVLLVNLHREFARRQQHQGDGMARWFAAQGLNAGE